MIDSEVLGAGDGEIAGNLHISREGTCQTCRASAARDAGDCMNAIATLPSRGSAHRDDTGTIGCGGSRAADADYSCEATLV
jgi:hypothetical protein